MKTGRTGGLRRKSQYLPGAWTPAPFLYFKVFVKDKSPGGEAGKVQFALASLLADFGDSEEA